MAKERVRRGFADRRAFAVPLAGLALAEVLALKYVPDDSFSLARPDRIAVEFVHLLTSGTLFAATGETLEGALEGLAVGGVLGLLSGIILGLSRPADRLSYLSIEMFRPISPAALIPLALLIYGFGSRMEIAIVAFTTLWPILVLTRAAVRDTEPALLEVARVLRLSFYKRATRIVLPAAVPRVFVAFRLAAAIALIVAVTVEVVADPRGLGYGMMAASQSLHPARSFAFLVWIGIVGWVFNAALIACQRRFFGSTMEGRHR